MITKTKTKSYIILDNSNFGIITRALMIYADSIQASIEEDDNDKNEYVKEIHDLLKQITDEYIKNNPSVPS